MFLVFGFLIIFALKNAPIRDIWVAIRALQLWQLVVILIVNAILYILVSLRWWIIVRTQLPTIPFMPLLWVRIAVFGVSYFTFGPQIGGEPLQVLVLQRIYGLTLTRATASVLLDKLLEFLVNFLLLGLGFIAVLQSGLLTLQGFQFGYLGLLFTVLITFPIIHLIFLSKRIYPITRFLHNLPFISKKNRLVRFVRVSEWLVGAFCKQHTLALLGSTTMSILAGIGMLMDYAIMLSFLGIKLPFWKIVAGWTAGWLSFLMPLPGGLGALEASQVFVFGIYGFSAAVAISLTLLMRSRDLFIGGLGLLLASSRFSKKKIS
ncbi:MAG: lysylphosphatidylglycerol synthase transmembrane domain-containing protein [Chloroflexota bacterium]